MDLDAFAPRIEALLGHIEEMEGARLPGSRRAGAIAKARSEGIVVPIRYVAAVRRLADGRH